MMLLWLQFSFKDAVDIFLVAVSLYYIYHVLKSSGSKTLFMGIITFFLIWVLVSKILQMQLMGSILDMFISVGAISLVIIFQEEIRRFLFTLGSTKRWSFLWSLFHNDATEESEEQSRIVASIVLACLNMSRKKTGALIVIQESVDLAGYIHTGEMFNSEVNARLIENIFFKNSPLHDGAMIISDGMIRAAGCILPVATGRDLNKDLGLRHRSALGLAQETDAKVIIVSEERGKVSFAQNGVLHVDISLEELRQALEKTSLIGIE